MYYHLRGRLVEKNPTYVIVECGGVGYKVNISLTTFSLITDNESCFLYTTFIVREDSQTLYGFKTKKEKEVFNMLISVSGVGANTARLILSSLNDGEVIDAILSENVALLQSVKGIGAKTAQRTIIDLKGKISKAGFEDTGSATSIDSGKRNEAVQALEVLGFNKNAIEKTVNKIYLSDPNASVEQVIKKALNQL